MNSAQTNLEKRYEDGDTVPDTQSSHHFVPLSSSRIGHKLISEDESYVNNHNQMFLLFFKLEISFHRLMLPVHTTRFGGLAWLV